MERSIETSQLKEIVFNLMQDVIALNKYLGSISKVESPISNEDLIDALEFYKKEFGINTLLHTYNSLVEDEEMKKAQEISDLHCQTYIDNLLKLAKRE